MSSRQFKWALMVLAISGLAGGALSNWLLPKGVIAYAQKENTNHRVAAREFRLVDGEGETRAVLGLSEDGQPGLDLYDQAGKPRAALRLDEYGQPSLSLRAEAGKGAAVLGFTQYGQPGLYLSDKAGWHRAGLVLLEDGLPCLSLCDEAGIGRAGLDLFEDQPRLILLDATGNPLFSAP